MQHSITLLLLLVQLARGGSPQVCTVGSAVSYACLCWIPLLVYQPLDVVEDHTNGFHDISCAVLLTSFRNCRRSSTAGTFCLLCCSRCFTSNRSSSTLPLISISQMGYAERSESAAPSTVSLAQSYCTAGHLGTCGSP